MSPTLEVRWFENGPLPSRLRDWFEELEPEPPSTWTDVYLPCEEPGLNLKVRDVKMQIKRRLAGPTRQAFSPRAVGRYEEWIKWSFHLADGALALEDPDPTALWTPIEKTRHQRRFDAEAQSALTEALPTTPAATVMIELTSLTTPEETAWTLCLEAEGPPSSLVDTLTTAGTFLFDSDLPVSLIADHSFGYVRWLQQLPSVQSGPAPGLLIPPTE